MKKIPMIITTIMYSKILLAEFPFEAEISDNIVGLKYCNTKCVLEYTNPIWKIIARIILNVCMLRNPEKPIYNKCKSR